VNTTETTQRAHEAAGRAQEVATQVKDQALTMVGEARSSDLAGQATDVAHQVASQATEVALQVADRARDLAHGLANEVAERTGRKQPGKIRRLGTSLRHHPIRWTLGLGAIGGATYALMQKKKQQGSAMSAMSATSGAPAYGQSAPGQRTQDGPVTDMQAEAELTPQNEPVNR
jgi:hypothetical protein